ncbi:MAG: EAL domain-containing protein [Proteobacteria bacterium]|nr:EAL domain-containing protein [Pseudomonadota bacterium]
MDENSQIQLQTNIRHQSAIAQISRCALETDSIPVLLSEAVSVVADALLVKFVSVFEYDTATQSLVAVASTGFEPATKIQASLKLRQGSTVATTLSQAKPAVVKHTPSQLKNQFAELAEFELHFSHLTPIPRNGTPFGVIAIHTPATPQFERIELELLRTIAELISASIIRLQGVMALQKREDRFALALEGSHDGIWDWDLQTQEMFYSDRWRDMLGLSDQPVPAIFDSWMERVHLEDREVLRSALTSHLNDEAPYFSCEHRILHHDGSYRWMLSRGIAVRNAQGKAIRIAGSLSDITESKQAEHQLLRDALHDTLTNLPNRALFTDRLTQAIVRSNRHRDYLFAVLFVDFDRFKVINDSLGHSYGDQLLIELGSRLQECTRDVDTVARLGGDEFAILLEDLDSENKAEEVARRINQSLAEPFALAGREIVSNASIGVALSSLGYDNPDDMIRDADIAMYQAKNDGRARHVVFEKGMHVRAVTQLEMETDLRQAIDREEFSLAYQPVVDITSERIIGFEALIRWNHPEHGFIPPGDFIPIAEETKVIVPIGRWVLHNACAQMKRWQKQFPQLNLSISVNISPAQFTDPELIHDIKEVLQETKLSGDTLKLEITEGAIMENPHEVTNRLVQLKKLGIQFHVDDFGTGYSSLSHLHRFPIDALKVDRSFVISMAESTDNMEIVRTIIALAHNLKLTTVAEGVETKKDLEQLRLLKCDHAQGYYFSRPLDAAAALKYLKQDAAL